MARTIDEVVTAELGIAHMTIARLIWQVETLKEQVEALKQLVPAQEPPSEN
jgi:hypothetical protein